LEDRDSHNIRIIINGNKEEYEIIKVYEFNSDRKMMSVILKDDKGKLILFTKGADMAILPRLANYNDD
jgi:magnesium-transporting ATPase (P-type)